MRSLLRSLASLALVLSLAACQGTAIAATGEPAASPAPAPELPAAIDLAGKIDGRFAVHLHLDLDGGKVTGRYSYDQHGEDIPLRGTAGADGTLVLDELDAHGKASARFRGRLQASGAFGGEWQKAGSRKSRPFFLSTWIGAWDHRANQRFDSTALEITEATAETLAFHLSASSGGHTGEIEGTAQRDAGHYLWVDPEYGCRVDLEPRRDTIELTSNDACAAWGGMGVVFRNGTYVRDAGEAEPSLVELEVVATAEEEKALQALVGASYEDLFPGNCQIVGEDDDLDGFGARVRTCGVRGLFTEMEAIVMVAPGLKLWAAALQPEDHSVRYFTNDPAWKVKLPQTIETWRARFAERPVVFPPP